MPNKTQMSRFHIHDDLTAPEASLPVLKGAARRPGSSRTSSGCSPARPPRCAATRASARSCAAARCRCHARADRARRRRAPPLRARARAARAHRARQAGLGLDEIAARPRLDSRDEREAALLRYLHPLAEQRGTHRSTCTRRRARRAGATSSCWRRSRWSPWNPSRRWSTSPARSPSTAPWRRRGCCARRREPMSTGREAGPPRSTAGSAGRADSPSADSARRRLLPAPARGRRARRQALDRRDPRRDAPGRPMRFSEIAQAVPRSRTACCPSA